MSIEIVWSNRQCLAIMFARLIDIVLRHERVAENNVCIWVIWLQSQRLLTLLYRAVGVAFEQQRAAEIVVGFRIIVMEPKRSLVFIDCVIDLTSFLLNDSEIVVGHPGFRIFSYRCSPKCFQIAIHHALSPGQKTKASRAREPATPSNPLPISDLLGQDH